jgi:hypothetical protein
MASKRFKGKACAYCGVDKSSATGDHVIAREFFFEEDRANLPIVPACQSCNQSKSVLEHYATAALMAGTKHVEGDRYRREKVAPRIAQNSRLAHELGLGEPAHWLSLNSIIQPMHALKIDAQKLDELMGLIVRGLYHFHFGRPLDRNFWPDVAMQHPDHEGAIWASLAPAFPAGCTEIKSNLGRGSFEYSVHKSPKNEAFTVWQMRWHGGIPMHGDNTPPQGVSKWWAITRPTEEAVNAEKGRKIFG